MISCKTGSANDEREKSTRRRSLAAILWPFFWGLVCVSQGFLVAFFCFQIASQPHIPAKLQMTTTAPYQQEKLLNFILSLQTSHPRYDDLEPPLAALAKEQLPELQKSFRWLGGMNAMHLLRKQRQEYIYELWFRNGRVLVGIIVSPSGRLASLRLGLSQHL